LAGLQDLEEGVTPTWKKLKTGLGRGRIIMCVWQHLPRLGTHIYPTLQKEVERRRRGNINEGINELARIVPNGSGEKAKV
jgi:Helix-loop-helix DNA-binding domain